MFRCTLKVEMGTLESEAENAECKCEKQIEERKMKAHNIRNNLQNVRLEVCVCMCDRTSFNFYIKWSRATMII